MYFHLYFYSSIYITVALLSVINCYTIYSYTELLYNALVCYYLGTVTYEL